MMASSSISYSAVRTEPRTLLLPKAVGFFLSFRECFGVLFFQSDPQIGTVVNAACILTLLSVALFCRMGDASFHPASLLSVRPLRWILGFLALSFLSLLWTQASSPAAAAGYWAGMAAEVFVVALLMQEVSPEESAAALIKGFVWGACVVALIAWLLPTLPDQRIGDDEFLKPNAIGLLCATAALCAQYLRDRGAQWKWLAVALAITLLRSISKTSIIAFLLAETFYLLHDRAIRRRTKLYIGIMAAVVIACFSTLLESYIVNYSASSSDQAESLTGRTWIWAVSFSMAMEKPLLGYGLYAFRAVIPSFNAFQPWHAHNEMLQQFFEFGAVGLILLIGIYWSFLRAAWRSSVGGLRTFAIALFIFAVVHGLTDTVLFGFSLPLWILTAASIVFASMPQAKEVAGRA